jgi:hypothetical protein
MYVLRADQHPYARLKWVPRSHKAAFGDHWEGGGPTVHLYDSGLPKGRWLGSLDAPEVHDTVGQSTHRLSAPGRRPASKSGGPESIGGGCEARPILGRQARGPVSRLTICGEGRR